MGSYIRNISDPEKSVLRVVADELERWTRHNLSSTDPLKSEFFKMVDRLDRIADTGMSRTIKLVFEMPGGYLLGEHEFSDSTTAYYKTQGSIRQAPLGSVEIVNVQVPGRDRRGQ
jgi:hypothetical protein